jgi:hypothetical protein
MDWVIHAPADLQGVVAQRIPRPERGKDRSQLCFGGAGQCATMYTGVLISAPASRYRPAHRDGVRPPSTMAMGGPSRQHEHERCASERCKRRARRDAPSRSAHSVPTSSAWARVRDWPLHAVLQFVVRAVPRCHILRHRCCSRRIADAARASMLSEHSAVSGLLPQASNSSFSSPACGREEVPADQFVDGSFIVVSIGWSSECNFVWAR